MSEPSSVSSNVYGWDEKLAEGKQGEELVAKWLEYGDESGTFLDLRDDRYYQQRDIDFAIGGVFFEVKTDLKAHETGNLFLELDALEKSRADLWLFYLPQRDWLFRFLREDLLAYALAKADSAARTVTTEHQGRRWSVRGVPVPMSELLLKLQGQLHTKLSVEVAAYDDD